MDETPQQHSLWEDRGEELKPVDVRPNMDDEDIVVVVNAEHNATLSEHEREELRHGFKRYKAWLSENADPLGVDEFNQILAQMQVSVSPVPTQPETDDDSAQVPLSHMRLFFRALWDEHHILVDFNGMFYRPRTPPPRGLLTYFGLIDEEPGRPPRRTLAPAFMHAGRVGMGRISSSQISEAMFEMCIAPKEKWTRTAKGFPRYISQQGGAEIIFTLRPEVIDLKHLASQVATMEQARDTFSVCDWDTMTAMMAQVLSEGHDGSSAYIYADTILDYRQRQRKKGSDGFSAGHQRNMRLDVAETVQRWSYVYVTTKTLKVRRYGARNSVIYDTVDWNEKVIQLHGNATRREDDAELAWQYSFGTWFTTFLEKPNRFVAYILQKALAYHPQKRQWTKQLVHYLTLEIRKNADNGRELRRTVAELFEKAGIAVDLRYPAKAKDRLEGAVRDGIRDGAFRIEHDGKVLDASCGDEVSRWTVDSTDMPARNWFGTYLKQVIVFRADPETEHLYDDEIRRTKASGRKP